MLRRSLAPDVDPEIAEAMLRYFTRKRESSDVNRDKTDLVATFLYRHPRVPGQWERRGYGLDGSLPLSPFEIALIEILADADVPSLSEDHVQSLRQFDSLQREAEAFRDLHALLESGIIPRVRELKQAFGPSFNHPGVLATIAPYNAAFGGRFDRLFREAAGEIRSFAHALQEQGGNILGNVDGLDVTVEHVAAFEEGELLRIDYGTALEKFRRVSKLKKTLDQHPPIRQRARLIPAAVTKISDGPARSSSSSPLPLDLSSMRSSVTPQQITSEEGKLLRVEESVRVFVRVADPRFRQIVPMRYFNLILSPAEVEAYLAEYMEEKNERATVARLLLRLVAVVARMTTELEELRRAENSRSLAKMHADSLVVLLEVGHSVTESTRRAIAVLQQQARNAEAETLQASLKKLNACAASVERTLTSPPKVYASAKAAK